jgi:hypothetical protein
VVRGTGAVDDCRGSGLVREGVEGVTEAKAKVLGALEMQIADAKQHARDLRRDADKAEAKLEKLLDRARKLMFTD